MLLKGIRGLERKVGLEVSEVIYPSVSVKAVTFVDDINGGGSKNFVQAVMENCREKEVRKLWEFSKRKSNWMCIPNRKRIVESIDVEVKQGKLEKTKSYKFVGNYVNEKGNLDDQLKAMEVKSIAIVRETNTICCQRKIGKFELEAKKLVYEMQAVPAVFFNLETWTNLRISDVNSIQSMQGKILKGIHGLPKSTPYWGLLYELNILPITLVLTYKKLMLYHNLINSDDRRIAKQIVKEQERSGFKDCWFGNTYAEGEKIGIQIAEGLVEGKTKSSWKKKVKIRIREAFKREVMEKKEISKKMRFLEKQASETYLKEVFNDEARMALKIRLNMVDWIPQNFGKHGGCPLCGEEDSTEHVFNCNATMEGGRPSIKNLEDGEKMKEIVDLFMLTERRRREHYLDNIQVNFDCLRREGTIA